MKFPFLEGIKFSQIKKKTNKQKKNMKVSLCIE